MQSRAVAVTLSVFAFVAACACINDSDTLAVEAKGLPKVVDVIAGRFDRNPDLYYEMRLERVTQELLKDPTKLENYDDAAACCDRLGRSEDAIAWMDKKWAEMAKMELPKDSPHPYRYYANIGTMRAHKWLRRGAKADEIHLLKKAYEEIREAVKINADAHFGREWIQLQMMGDMLLSQLSMSQEGNLQLEHDALMQSHIPTNEFEAAPIMVEGFTGIIVLGAGWDSEKVWGEMHRWLALSENSRLVELTQYRWHELGGGVHVPSEETRVSRAYKALRENGEAYTKNREGFMLAKLERGEHPDTHPRFWDGYEEVAPVDIAQYDYRPNTPGAWIERAFTIVAASALALIVCLVTIKFLRVRARRMDA